MPVTKPNQIVAGASMHSVKRARDGSSNRSMAQNAALGLDNFAKLLQNDPLGTQNLAKEKQQQVSQANSKILDETGLKNPTPYSHGGRQSSLQNMLGNIQGLNGNTAGTGNMQGAAGNLQNMAGSLQSASGNMQNMASTTQGASSNMQAMSGSMQAATGNLEGMTPMQKGMLMSSQPLTMTRIFSNLDDSRAKGSDAAVLALRTAAHKGKEAVEAAGEAVSNVMGKLSRLFESGRDGVFAIGHDKVGGTSYGDYQIASNTGTMDEFLQFLDKQAPDYAKELRAAGPANTGSKEGEMPEAWRAIAARDPKNFSALQHDFIEQKHYNAAASKLAEHGIEAEKLSPVMREVLFSTAVQHGPSGAARIISRAVGEDATKLMQPMPGSDQGKTEEQVIKRIYGIRQNQFGSSTNYVQQAVTGRLNSEMQMALHMLKTGDIG